MRLNREIARLIAKPGDGSNIIFQEHFVNVAEASKEDEEAMNRRPAIVGVQGAAAGPNSTQAFDRSGLMINEESKE